MPQVAPRSQTLTRKTRILFSTGDLSSSLTLAIQTFFQLYFLTDVARLNPSTVGWVLGITRIWDAFNDPLIGLISDRIRSRHGRRRILLFYGSIPLGLFFALCWVVPPLEGVWLAAFYTVIIIAFDTAFTIVHVGFNSLTPTMTFDYDERSRLNGCRMLFSLGGTLAAIIFATVAGDFIQDERTRFATVGITLGLVAMIPPWIVAHVAREADPANEVSKMPLAKALKTTLSNRAFIRLSLMYFACWTATSVMAATLVYFASYYLKVPEWSNYLVLAAQASAVFSVPLCVWMAYQWDKPKAFIIGTCYWCLVLIGFFAVPETAVWAAFVCAILSGPGIATAAVIPWSMLPDVVEEEQKQTGERREGSYYAFASFFQKLGTGVALWGIGQALAVSGYVTPSLENQFPEQPQSAIDMIRWIIGPATIVLLLLSIPFAWKYPITRRSHVETMEQLNSS